MLYSNPIKNTEPATTISAKTAPFSFFLKESADDPVVPVQGIILGYANRENPSPLRLKWKANGAATVPF